MFEIVVRAFILDNKGRILLGKRAKKPEINKWALVGGKVELNEVSENAVVRELKEELQINFRPKFEFFTENIFPDQNLHTIILFYSGKYTGKIKIKNDELLEVRFFSKKDLLLKKDIAWDHKKAIGKYFN